MFYMFDPLALVIMLVTAAMAGLTALWVKSTFHHWSQVPARNGMTGAQIARAILDFNGITDVTIERVPGNLSDHYDPSNKTLRLSDSVHSQRSVAALGVAAHEVGHAIQHARAYVPLTFRSAIVPLVGFASNFSWILLLIAIVIGSTPLAWAGVGLFAITTLFTLVTLPVEFDASRRALVALEDGRILAGEELDGARKVLRAAASTYVAAAVTSVAWLLYYLFRTGLIGGRSND